MDGEAGWRKNKRGEENRTYIYIYIKVSIELVEEIRG